MREIACRVGRSLLPFALGSVVFVAGCPVSVGQTNAEACVRANSVGAVCLGEEQGLTPEQVQGLVAGFEVGCAFISGNEGCDWRPMADCMEAATCEELSDGAFVDCEALQPDPASCMPFGLGGQPVLTDEAP